MSHPLFFRGITYFYPVGNTSAVRLTEHLPPEQNANVLLLACGDPRHILYTVHTNADIEPQKLDITCCDLEPAVLARNALLFTFLADGNAPDKLDLLWNIFYHFVLDQASLSLLIERCRELVAFAKDLESWNSGPYARFLTFCDKRTLTELCRMWSLYVSTTAYTPDQYERFKKSFLTGMKEVNDKMSNDFVVTSARSAGPLVPLAVSVVADQFRRFWLAGITDDGLHSTEQATFVNPTFAFSASKEKFSAHYGTDPIAGFQLAEALVNSRGETPILQGQKLVRAARSQFSEWCTSVVKLLKSASTSSNFVVRMFTGDVLMLCQAFSHFNSYGSTVTPIPCSPWKASKIEFEESQYGEKATTPAPTTFNIIDTSNISDHVGLLNLLVVVVPVLSRSPSATLYTEALLSYGDASPNVIFERLCGDLQTMSLLLGIVPSAFLSRFTTRSNVHETLLQGFNPKGTQYHERIAWKRIYSEHLISFLPYELARLLFDVYLKMFSDENMVRQLQNMSLLSPRAFLEATLVHYTRRSFVQLLSHIKSRIQTDWSLVMREFDDHITRDNSLILNSNFYQEMCCHFHLLDITTFTSMEESFISDLRTKTKSPIFRDWESIPAVVTIVLEIPRSKINAVEPELSRAGTPVLLCEIRNESLWNMFAHVSAAYGKLETSGTGQKKTAVIVEKEEESSSALIVYFSAPSSSLLLSRDATVGFRTRPSPRSVSGSLLEAIFSAPLGDSQRVHILAEPPVAPCPGSSIKDTSKQALHEGKRDLIVHMDDSHTKIRSLTMRIDITDTVGQASLVAGSPVKIESASAHGVSVCIGEYKETVYFPLPVDIANTKVRIARQSMYTELVAPLALSMHIQNEASIAKRFISVLDGGVPVPWNVHRVNLDRCPPFKPTEFPGTSKWLVPHVSLMFSHRERAVREMKTPAVKDTFVNLKDSLHTLLLSVAGVEGPTRSVFALQNTTTRQILAVMIVGDLRLDLGSHTVLADAWVAPGSAAIRNKLASLDVVTVGIKVDPEESEAWRYLLPLLIERCRTWTHKPSCEYLVHGTMPLHPEHGADPDKSPFCTCGAGSGTKAMPRQFRSVASYMTRAAISPLFAIPYLESVGMIPPNQTGCKTCGKEVGTLLLCSKCKGARYCSKECQVKDWKIHKKDCV